MGLVVCVLQTQVCLILLIFFVFLFYFLSSKLICWFILVMWWKMENSITVCNLRVCDKLFESWICSPPRCPLGEMFSAFHKIKSCYGAIVPNDSLAGTFLKSQAFPSQDDLGFILISPVIHVSEMFLKLCSLALGVLWIRRSYYHTNSVNICQNDAFSVFDKVLAVAAILNVVDSKGQSVVNKV